MKQLGDDRRQVNEAVKIKGRRGTLIVPPQEAGLVNAGRT